MAPRTRTKDSTKVETIADIGYRQQLVSGGCSAYSWTGTLPSSPDQLKIGEFMSMTDDGTLPSVVNSCLPCEYQPPVFKPVDHYKHFRYFSDLTKTVDMGHPGDGFVCPGGLVDFPAIVAPSWGSDSLSAYMDLNWSVGQDAGYTQDELMSAIQQLLPTLANWYSNASINLGETLIEIREVMRLKNLLTIHSDPLTNVANQHLGFNFGVLPLYNEIMNIFNLMDTIDARIKSWNQKAARGEPITVHATINRGQSDYNFVENSTLSWINLEHKYACYNTWYNKIHLQFIPKPIPEELGWEHWEDALGLRNWKSIAWNVTPFSWAVDYFFNIGDWIESLAGSGPLFEIEVVSLGLGSKHEQVVDCQGFASAFGFTNEHVCDYTEYVSNYSRQLLDDELLEVAKTYVPQLSFQPHLTGRRISYLAAVAYQLGFKSK